MPRADLWPQYARPAGYNLYGRAPPSLDLVKRLGLKKYFRDKYPTYPTFEWLSESPWEKPRPGCLVFRAVCLELEIRNAFFSIQSPEPPMQQRIAQRLCALNTGHFCGFIWNPGLPKRTARPQNEDQGRTWLRWIIVLSYAGPGVLRLPSDTPFESLLSPPYRPSRRPVSCTRCDGNTSICTEHAWEYLNVMLVETKTEPSWRSRVIHDARRWSLGIMHQQALVESRSVRNLTKRSSVDVFTVILE